MMRCDEWWCDNQVELIVANVNLGMKWNPKFDEIATFSEKVDKKNSLIFPVQAKNRGDARSNNKSGAIVCKNVSRNEVI